MIVLAAGEWVSAGVMFAIVFGVASAAVGGLGAMVVRADRRNRSHPRGRHLE